MQKGEVALLSAHAASRQNRLRRAVWLGFPTAFVQPDYA